MLEAGDLVRSSEAKLYPKPLGGRRRFQRISKIFEMVYDRLISFTITMISMKIGR